MVTNPVPLPAEHKEVLAKDVSWSDFLWGDNSVTVREQVYGPLTSFKMYDMRA